jgi:uncharacterized protein (TIGR02646 family)
MAAPLTRSTPQALSNYGDYRQTLRVDFWFACAYCNIAESEAAGLGFHIDHYQSATRVPELEHEYTNLFWACQPCNSSKGDLPEDEERFQGYRFFCADHDDPEEHFKTVGLRIEWKTERVGRYTVVTLNLNRQQLREIRRIRESLYKSAMVVANGLRYLQGLRIDQLPPETRRRFLEIKRELQETAATTLAYVNEQLAKDEARSVLLDVDAEAAERAKARRAWLAELRAQVPGVRTSARPPAPAKKSARKSARAQRKK